MMSKKENSYGSEIVWTLCWWRCVVSNRLGWLLIRFFNDALAFGFCCSVRPLKVEKERRGEIRLQYPKIL